MIYMGYYGYIAEFLDHYEVLWTRLARLIFTPNKACHYGMVELRTGRMGTLLW
ncbi:MAG: hypothetical protein ACJA0Z_001215 [Halioglobus sp.]|jgi:hypothetical protein